MCDPRLGNQCLDSSPLNGGSTITTTKHYLTGQLYQKMVNKKEKGEENYLQFVGNILSSVDRYTKELSSQEIISVVAKEKQRIFSLSRPPVITSIITPPTSADRLQCPVIGHRLHNA